MLLVKMHLPPFKGSQGWPESFDRLHYGQTKSLASSETNLSELHSRVADKLPRPNLLLLKHLVSVLYLISRSSEVNKMDASNLAICVGPNMLTRENDQNLSFEAQKDLNNKVRSQAISEELLTYHLTVYF